MDEFMIIMIPLLGTSLGAAMVFFMKNGMDPGLERLLLGFAAGVMIAASVWSLLIPAIEMAQEQGKNAWLPAASGFLLGVLFLLLLDGLVSRIQTGDVPPVGMRGGRWGAALPGPEARKGGRSMEGVGTKSGRKTSECPGTLSGSLLRSKSPDNSRRVNMLVLAVVLHNLPEGMAVGVALAGAMTENTGITMAGAMLLSAGIAIQNLPEGAIISMPLCNTGTSRRRAFWYGVLSGVVEPAGAVLTLLLAELVIPVLPWLLAFAAGAMMYVVAEELIPGACSGERGKIGTVSMAAGFVLMMILDVAM